MSIVSGREFAFHRVTIEGPVSYVPSVFSKILTGLFVTFSSASLLPQFIVPGAQAPILRDVNIGGLRLEFLSKSKALW